MSKVEVNTIEPQCGTTLTVGKCTTSVAVPGNVVKSNALQASDGGNIVSQSGTDITLGASGDTINLASGASQSGFGRTGTVDWITTPKVTGDSPITGVTGKGYFLNTTAGAITVNLPAGAAGSIVSMADYAATWQTNNVTVSANGSEKIGGVDADATLDTKGQSVTFVYVDSTQGWLNTMDSTSNVRGSGFPQATGGDTIATCGNYKMHIFTGPGTFCVSSLSPGPSGNPNNADFMVVGGGGGGGAQGGGGGAGGYRESPGATTCYTASPLGASPMVFKTLAASPYSVVVGGGGAGSTVNSAAGASGGVATVFCISSAGGGGGGSDGPKVGVAGGSGGGGGWGNAGAAGNTPSTTPSQGNTGGTGYPNSGSHGGGGGGAAGAVGENGSSPKGGDGGIGSNTGILASSPATPTTGEPGPAAGRYFAGGGGGNANPGSSGGGAGGVGGGGNGADPGETVTNGADNTGGGGGSAHGWCNPPYTNGNGGSGIVIIRYKYQ